MTIVTSSRYVPPSGGCIYRVAGELITVKATGSETGGAYTLFEAWTAPDGGAPPHLHRYEDEAVFVLEGLYAARVGTQSLTLAPGAYAFVPRETVHAFINRSDAPARMLIVVSPAGIHERFIAAVGILASAEDGPTACTVAEMATFTAAGAKYGVEVVSPLSE